jgi:opacity protein-like surface antigen
MTMRLRLAVAVLWMGLAAEAAAVEIEIAGQVGLAMPTYEQTFTYDPGPLSVSFPPFGQITANQNGEFQAEGKGSSAFGGAITFYLAPSFGLEARVDSAGLDIETSGAVFHVSANLPAPIPDFSTNVDLGEGRFDVGRLQPLSLNVKLRTPGRVRLALSGGVSYLPSVEATAEQPIGLGITGIRGLTMVDVGSLKFRAEAAPGDDDAGNRIGANVGAGVQIGLAAKVSLTLEARGFLFPKHELEWQPVIPGPLSILEQQLLDRIRDEVEPIEFNPTFFTVTAGLAIGF